MSCRTCIAPFGNAPLSASFIGSGLLVRTRFVLLASPLRLCPSHISHVSPRPWYVSPGTSPEDDSGRRTNGPPSFTIGSVLERAQGASQVRVAELAFPFMVPVLSLVPL